MPRTRIDFWSLTLFEDEESGDAQMAMYANESQDGKELEVLLPHAVRRIRTDGGRFIVCDDWPPLLRDDLRSRGVASKFTGVGNRRACPSIRKSRFDRSNQ